jgi:ribosomal protein S18 acetylase RimI-like enzyme
MAFSLILANCFSPFIRPAVLLLIILNRAINTIIICPRIKLMEHLLDNPAWNALISGNKELANGNDRARYFPAAVSPFVGTAGNTSDNLKLLFDTIPFEGNFALVNATELNIPQPWNVIQHAKVLQMVYDAPLKDDAADTQIVPLNADHIPAMLTLTKLTNPGPFLQDTINFGHYTGIFEGDRLIAMSGQRMNPEPYAEISAVCTHPDYLGKGYAGMLILNQISRIRAAGSVPFLHVLSANARAISLYKSLGFSIRKEIFIYSIRKISSL